MTRTSRGDEMKRIDPKTGAQEHHLAVRRTARFWTLGEQQSAGELWVVLHGYKQLARRFLRRFAPLDDGSRFIVAPEALSRFYVSPSEGRHGVGSVVGATWMTREDRRHEIEDYVDYLDRLVGHVLPAHSKKPLTILGFSQGVATASRWCVHGMARPVRLVLWGDTLPPDLDMNEAAVRLASVDVTLVRGTQDPAISPDLVDDERARLTQAGIDYRVLTYAGGHDIDPGALLRVAAGE